MGVVYRARQISLNRPVALKMILEGALASPALLTRFQIEGEAAAQLNHPNIVPIYETGQWEGRRFFSMKLLEGGSLGDRLEEFALPAGAMGSEAAQERQRAIARLVGVIAGAVHHAHQRGVLHRDLKPANILFDADGKAHVTDFGLAKLLEEESWLTRSGAHLGTPAYMAPEQAAGDAQVTTAADVYGLGAILYHLLTGRPPFHGGTAVETMRQVVDRDAPLPNRVNPSVNRELSIICAKCLDKDPGRRYTSARALAQDLERWQNGETITAVPATAWDIILRWRRRNPALSSLIVLVALLLVAVAAVSTVAAFRVNRARQAAVAAEVQAREKLWESYLAQARAQRWSGKAGRKFDGLRAVADAAAIRPTIELRNEAIACLAMTDFRRIAGGPKTDNPDQRVFIDPARDRYAFADANGAISVRQLTDNQELLRIPAVISLDTFSEFSADGKWLSATYRDLTGRVWDLQTGRQAFAFPMIAGLRFSADASQIAIVQTNRDLTIRQLAGDRLQRTFRLPVAMERPIWNPNGRTLAMTGGSNVVIVDVSNGQVIRQWDLGYWVLGMAWHPDGVRIACGTVSQALPIFNANTGEKVASLVGHQGSVTGVCFSPDGSLLASDSWDGKLRLWDVAQTNEIASIASPSEEVDFSADSRRLFVYGYSQTLVDTFEIASNAVTLTLPGSIHTVETMGDDSLLFGSNGWLATCRDGDLAIWSPYSSKPLVERPNTPSTYLNDIGGRFLTWGRMVPYREEGGAVQLGDPQKFYPTVPAQLQSNVPATLLTRFGKDDEPGWLVGTRDGKLGAIAFNDRCYLFDLVANSLQAVTGKQDWLRSMTIDPRRKWVATGGWNYRNVKVWDAATGGLIAELPTGFSPSVGASPDGRWLVVCSGGEYAFWRTSDWKVDHRVSRPDREGFPSPIAFSADGKTLAVADTRSAIRLLSPDTGETLALIDPTPDREIVMIAVNADGSELAVNRKGARTQIWHLGRIRGELAQWNLAW